MKKVLVITYFFPPSGSTGALRPLKFVKYLPQFGWQPVVLTCKNPFDFEIGQNRELLKEVPGKTKVFGTLSFEPLNLFWKWRSKRGHLSNNMENNTKNRNQTEKEESFIKKLILDIFRMPDSSQGWIPFALLRGLRIIAKEKVSTIIATAPPYSSFIIGYLLSKLTGKPLILDYRDPWRKKSKFNPFVRINNLIERKIVGQARYIISVTDTWSRELQEKYDVEAKSNKYVVITNGYDSDELNGDTNLFDKFTFLHAGELYNNDGIEDFINAISDITKEDLCLRRNLSVLFVGKRPELSKFYMLERLGIAKFERRIPRRECLGIMAKANILLVFLKKDKVNSGCIASKVFDYMMFRKPVLAIVGEGETRNLIEKTKIGIAVNYADRETLKEVIRGLYYGFKDGKLKNTFDEDSIQKFERRELTRKLVGVFEKVEKGG